MYRIMKENTTGWTPGYTLIEEETFGTEAEAVAWAAEKVRSLLPGSTVSTTRVERNDLLGFFFAEGGRGVEVKASIWTPETWWQSRELYVVPDAE